MVMAFDFVSRENTPKECFGDVRSLMRCLCVRGDLVQILPSSYIQSMNGRKREIPDRTS